MQKDYFFGFIVNQRGAKFTPENWDASVGRMGRIDEALVADIMRSHFPLGKMIRFTYHTLRGRAQRRLRSLLGRG